MSSPIRANPFIACRPEELQRLGAAASQDTPDGAVIRARIRDAEAALTQPLAFPPRGGQHNQWYQCDPCQVALTTVDSTHHRCPSCRTVYTGAPYDDVIYAHQHQANLWRMLTAAWAWAITGHPEFAEDATAVLLGYSARYRAYPLHDSAQREPPGASAGHLFEQTLNEAVAMASQIAPAYDLLCTAPSFTPARQAEARDGLIRPMLARIDANKAGKSNWQTWHNAALFAGAMLVGDTAMADATISDARNGFLFQMRDSVSPEGMWYENSWSYHAYTLSALVAHAEAARRCGVDLWSQPALARMFRLPLQYEMADGALPRFGDAVGDSPGAAPAAAEAACHAYRDPALRRLLPVDPSWESVLYGREPTAAPAEPGLTSRVVPGAGHAILRSHGGAGLTAAITFGPYGGFHGHFDKLSFVLFGHGQELGVDPGRAASQAYRLPVHTQWYKGTISHNAVIVDGEPQKPAEGMLEAFAADANSALVAASCDRAYPGVRHRRLLYLRPSYLLVIDELAAEAPHRFDWVYHGRGSSSECDGRGGTPGDLLPLAGGEYIRWTGGSTTDGMARAAIRAPRVTTCVTCAADGPTEARCGSGVGASVDDRVPLVVFTRRGQTARFAAVIEPVAAGREPEVTAVTAEPVEHGLLVTVQRGGAADAVLLRPDGRCTAAPHGQAALAAGAP